MSNSLYQQLMAKQSVNDVNTIMQWMKVSSNPRNLLTQLAQQNGAVAKVLKEVDESGGNAKDLFYKRAQELGIDPNSILSQLR